jgi:hypothetical protein
MSSLQNAAITGQNADALPPSGGTVRGASSRWRDNLLLFIVAVAALALRIAAAGGDLVQDEVWSRKIATGAESAWHIFVIPSDNNHILNTLVLYALGPRAPLWAYRLPAVLAGAAALWFAYRLAHRWGSVAAFSVLLLLSFSHVLILFGTEARGYGYLACSTLAAWWALEQYFDRRRLRYAFAFGLASSLGLLSHLTFLFGYLAFGIYATMKLGPRRGHWQRLVILNALPTLTCMLLLFTYILGIGIGGGNPTPLSETLLATLSLMAGGPERGQMASVAAGITGGLIAASLASEFRIDRARGAMFLTAIILAPGMVLGLTGHAFFYPRYFLVPMIFGYVAVGSLCARVFQGGRFARCTVSLLLVCYVVCNLAPVVKLIREGRGQYSRAVHWMAEHTAGPNVTVSSDHDFRNAWVIEFHAERDVQAYPKGGKTLDYIYMTESRKQGTEWFLRHSFSGEPAPADSFMDSFGNQYELVQVFPAASVSGSTWWLFRRQ